jgi:hypothetical protein
MLISYLKFILIVAVFKFVEHPENNERPMEQKSKVKFKIVSLKVKGPIDYVPELVSSADNNPIEHVFHLFSI